MEFILIKLQTWRPVTLFKKTPKQVFFCEIFENFKSANSEEHLWATATERLRKISPLLVLGKPILDGKRHNWAIEQQIFFIENMSTYERHEVSLYNIHVYTKMPFAIFFRSQKRAKVIMITFKISWTTYCSRTIALNNKMKYLRLESFQILSTFFTFI